MKKVTITCAHCGCMFQISISENGVSARRHQHSPGCGKSTNVAINNGNITKTNK
ncbi:MAG: hypothetical protein P8L23_02325 [Flavobacteriales bacterium]|nr:hypothetical protein [Flavobacteriales bacterium]